MGLYVDKEKKCEKVIAVKTFGKARSVAAESVFTVITEHVDQHILDKVYSVTSDNTALNTGKMSGVNKRLADFHKLHHDRNIHLLECLFHVYKIYFTHAIAKIEGKKEGNRNYGRRIINDIPMPDVNKLVDREKLVVPVTKMASFQLRKMIEWFADEKEQRNDHSFRNDHMSLLALS